MIDEDYAVQQEADVEFDVDLPEFRYYIYITKTSNLLFNKFDKPSIKLKDLFINCFVIIELFYQFHKLFYYLETKLARSKIIYNI